MRSGVMRSDIAKSALDNSFFLSLKVDIQNTIPLLSKSDIKSLKMMNAPNSNTDKKNRLNIKVARLGYPQSETENVDIAKKELSAITYLGGVLGFIIGFVPAILNMI